MDIEIMLNQQQLRTVLVSEHSIRCCLCFYFHSAHVRLEHTFFSRFVNSAKMSLLSKYLQKSTVDVKNVASWKIAVNMIQFVQSRSCPFKHFGFCHTSARILLCVFAFHKGINLLKYCHTTAYQALRLSPISARALRVTQVYICLANELDSFKKFICHAYQNEPIFLYYLVQILCTSSPEHKIKIA